MAVRDNNLKSQLRLGYSPVAPQKWVSAIATPATEMAISQAAEYLCGPRRIRIPGVPRLGTYNTKHGTLISNDVNEPMVDRRVAGVGHNLYEAR